MLKRCTKKILIGATIVLAIMGFTGCSIAAYKPSANKVEQVAKECINSEVQLLRSDISMEKEHAAINYVYSFQGSRGISFDVTLCDRYFAIVEPIPPFLSDYNVYHTNYDKQVIAYYKDEIGAILNVDCVADYDIFSYIDIKFCQGTSYEDMANIVVQIDQLLALDDKCAGISQSDPESDDNAYWDGGVSAPSIIVETEAEVDGDGLYKPIEISTNEDNRLSYQTVLETLKQEE